MAVHLQERLPLKLSSAETCSWVRRSAARNEKRMEALRECVRMITANAGGCTTPFPFEAAIWLLEEQEELYGGAIPIYKSVSSLSFPSCSPVSTCHCQGFLTAFSGTSPGWISTSMHRAPFGVCGYTKQSSSHCVHAMPVNAVIYLT